jgi:mycofactocin precursor
MPEPTAAPQPDADEREPVAVAEQEMVMDDELLVEDVSIDGMCGVY